MAPIIPPQTQQATQSTTGTSTVLPWRTAKGVHAGVTVANRLEVCRRARAILESDEYEESLLRRIKADKLPPAMEVTLWYYAYGKPSENINVTHRDAQEDLSTLGVTELQKRAKELSDQLEEAKRVEDAIPAQYKVSA